MGHKILIVDDDRLNTTLVKFGLAEKRYDVSYAMDGLEGLDMVKTSRPDLVILDIRMPKMNGYEFMQELSDLMGSEKIPVIMLTADETMEDIFRMEGVVGYFVKPVDLPALAQKVEECLGPND